MLISYKYRIYPTGAQVKFLSSQLREACDLYNCALQERIGAWKTCRKSINYYDQANQLKEMRAEGLVGLQNFSCCQDVLRRIDKAFKAFFRRAQAGNKPGFPRFRSSARYDSITFPSYGDGCRLLDNKKIRIQGAGLIKIKLHRSVHGAIKTVSIKRDIDKWYVILSAENNPDPLPFLDTEIGIDVGLDAFATLSDSSEIENPRYLNNEQARLRRSQRKLARSKRGSNRRRKTVMRVAKRHKSVANQRSNFHHSISRWLVNSYGRIAVEDLNISGLTRGILARSVNDVGWSSFFEKLAYKAAWAGRLLLKVDPYGTSQTCLCGGRVPKTLSDRWHNCQACGLSAPRDVVSAQVILSRARSEPSWLNVGVVVPSVPREAICV